MDYIVKAYKDWKLHSQFQEIVPDDMDDTEYMFNEKQSIRESARSLKKYGSTCCNNHMRNNETLIRHEIEKTDTLQGIALKYGCTTEQIRRANRLFASDSLFLRQFLLVPVEKSSPYYPQNDASSTTSSNDTTASPVTPDLSASQSESGFDVINEVNNATNHEFINGSSSGGTQFSTRFMATNGSSTGAGTPLPTRPYSIAGELLVQTNDAENPALLHSQHNAASSSKQSKSLDSVAAMTPDEENRKCINDFLNKIDNTISESRKYVERSKDMITQSDDDLFNTTDIVQRRRSNQLNNSYKNNNNRPPNHQRHSSTGSGNSDTAQLLNTTQTRRVQNSLKRLEKQQDDFFEL